MICKGTISKQEYCDDGARLSRFRLVRFIQTTLHKEEEIYFDKEEEKRLSLSERKTLKYKLYRVFLDCLHTVIAYTLNIPNHDTICQKTGPFPQTINTFPLFSPLHL